MTTAERKAQPALAAAASVIQIERIQGSERSNRSRRQGGDVRGSNLPDADGGSPLFESAVFPLGLSKPSRAGYQCVRAKASCRVKGSVSALSPVSKFSLTAAKSRK